MSAGAESGKAPMSEPADLEEQWRQLRHGLLNVEKRLVTASQAPLALHDLSDSAMYFVFPDASTRIAWGPSPALSVESAQRRSSSLGSADSTGPLGTGTAATVAVTSGEKASSSTAADRADGTWPAVRGLSTIVASCPCMIRCGNYVTTHGTSASEDTGRSSSTAGSTGPHSASGNSAVAPQSAVRRASTVPAFADPGCSYKTLFADPLVIVANAPLALVGLRFGAHVQVVGPAPVFFIRCHFSVRPLRARCADVLASPGIDIAQPYSGALRGSQAERRRRLLYLISPRQGVQHGPTAFTTVSSPHDDPFRLTVPVKMHSRRDTATSTVDKAHSTTLETSVSAVAQYHLSALDVADAARVYLCQCEVAGGPGGSGLTARGTAMALAKDCSFQGSTISWAAVEVQDKAYVEMEYSTITGVLGCGAMARGKANLSLKSSLVVRCGVAGIVALEDAQVALSNTGIELTASGTNLAVSGNGFCFAETCTFRALQPTVAQPVPTDAQADGRSPVPAAAGSSGTESVASHGNHPASPVPLGITPEAETTLAGLQTLLKRGVTEAVERLAVFTSSAATPRGDHPTVSTAPSALSGAVPTPPLLTSSQSVIVTDDARFDSVGCEYLCEHSGEARIREAKEAAEDGDDSSADESDDEKLLFAEAVANYQFPPTPLPSLADVAEGLRRHYIAARHSLAAYISLVRRQYSGADYMRYEPSLFSRAVRAPSPATTTAAGAPPPGDARDVQSPLSASASMALASPQLATVELAGTPPHLLSLLESAGATSIGDKDDASAAAARTPATSTTTVLTNVTMTSYQSLANSAPAASGSAKVKWYRDEDAAWSLPCSLLSFGAQPAVMPNATVHLVLRDRARVHLTTNTIELRHRYLPLASVSAGVISSAASDHTSSSGTRTVPYACVAVLIDFMPFFSFPRGLFRESDGIPLFSYLQPPALNGASLSEDSASRTPLSAAHPHHRATSTTSTSAADPTRPPSSAAPNHRWSTLLSEANVLRYLGNDIGPSAASAREEPARAGDRSDDSDASVASVLDGSAIIVDPAIGYAWGLVTAVPMSLVKRCPLAIPRSAIENVTVIEQIEAWAFKIREHWARVEVAYDSITSSQMAATQSGSLTPTELPAELQRARNNGNIFVSVSNPQLDIMQDAKQQAVTLIETYLSLTQGTPLSCTYRAEPTNVAQNLGYSVAARPLSTLILNSASPLRRAVDSSASSSVSSLTSDYPQDVKLVASTDKATIDDTTTPDSVIIPDDCAAGETKLAVPGRPQPPMLSSAGVNSAGGYRMAAMEDPYAQSELASLSPPSMPLSPSGSRWEREHGGQRAPTSEPDRTTPAPLHPSSASQEVPTPATDVKGPASSEADPTSHVTPSVADVPATATRDDEDHDQPNHLALRSSVSVKEGNDSQFSTDYASPTACASTQGPLAHLPAADYAKTTCTTDTDDASASSDHEGDEASGAHSHSIVPALQLPLRRTTASPPPPKDLTAEAEEVKAAVAPAGLSADPVGRHAGTVDEAHSSALLTDSDAPRSTRTTHSQHSGDGSLHATLDDSSTRPDTANATGTEDTDAPAKADTEAITEKPSDSDAVDNPLLEAVTEVAQGTTTHRTTPDASLSPRPRAVTFGTAEVITASSDADAPWSNALAGDAKSPPTPDEEVEAVPPPAPTTPPPAPTAVVAPVALKAFASEAPSTVTSAHTKVFTGDWSAVVQHKPDTLRKAFRLDVSEACELAPSDVLECTFALGSLHATALIRHAVSLSTSAIDERFAEYDFPLTSSLLANTRASPPPPPVASDAPLAEAEGAAVTVPSHEPTVPAVVSDVAEVHSAAEHETAQTTVTVTEVGRLTPQLEGTPLALTTTPVVRVTVSSLPTYSQDTAPTNETVHTPPPPPPRVIAQVHTLSEPSPDAALASLHAHILEPSTAASGLPVETPAHNSQDGHDPARTSSVGLPPLGRNPQSAEAAAATVGASKHLLPSVNTADSDGSDVALKRGVVNDTQPPAPGTPPPSPVAHRRTPSVDPTSVDTGTLTPLPQMSHTLYPARTAHLEDDDDGDSEEASTSSDDGGEVTPWSNALAVDAKSPPTPDEEVEAVPPPAPTTPPPAPTAVVAPVALKAFASEAPSTVTSAHTKVFTGDWSAVVQHKPDTLRKAFRLDVSEACELAPSDVLECTFALGSLHATALIRHAVSLSTSAIDERFAEYDFPLTSSLLANTRASPPPPPVASDAPLAEAEGAAVTVPSHEPTVPAVVSDVAEVHSAAERETAQTTVTATEAVTPAVRAPPRHAARLKRWSESKTSEDLDTSDEELPPPPQAGSDDDDDGVWVSHDETAIDDSHDAPPATDRTRAASEPQPDETPRSGSEAASTAHTPQSSASSTPVAPLRASAVEAAFPADTAIVHHPPSHLGGSTASHKSLSSPEVPQQQRQAMADEPQETRIASPPHSQDAVVFAPPTSSDGSFSSSYTYEEIEEEEEEEEEEAESVGMAEAKAAGGAQRPAEAEPSSASSFSHSSPPQDNPPLYAQRPPSELPKLPATVTDAANTAAVNELRDAIRDLHQLFSAQQRTQEALASALRNESAHQQNTAAIAAAAAIAALDERDARQREAIPPPPAYSSEIPAVSHAAPKPEMTDTVHAGSSAHSSRSASAPRLDSDDDGEESYTEEEEYTEGEEEEYEEEEDENSASDSHDEDTGRRVTPHRPRGSVPVDDTRTNTTPITVVSVRHMRAEDVQEVARGHLVRRRVKRLRSTSHGRRETQRRDGHRVRRARHHHRHGERAPSRTVAQASRHHRPPHTYEGTGHSHEDDSESPSSSRTSSSSRSSSSSSSDHADSIPSSLAEVTPIGRATDDIPTPVPNSTTGKLLLSRNAKEHSHERANTSSHGHRDDDRTASENRESVLTSPAQPSRPRRPSSSVLRETVAAARRAATGTPHTAPLTATATDPVLATLESAVADQSRNWSIQLIRQLLLAQLDPEYYLTSTATRTRTPAPPPGWSDAGAATTTSPSPMPPMEARTRNAYLPRAEAVSSLSRRPPSRPLRRGRRRHPRSRSASMPAPVRAVPVVAYAVAAPELSGARATTTTTTAATAHAAGPSTMQTVLLIPPQHPIGPRRPMSASLPLPTRGQPSTHTASSAARLPPTQVLRYHVPQALLLSSQPRARSRPASSSGARRLVPPATHPLRPSRPATAGTAAHRGVRRGSGTHNSHAQQPRGADLHDERLNAMYAQSAWKSFWEQATAAEQARRRLSPHQQDRQVDRLYTQPILSAMQRELVRECVPPDNCTFTPTINEVSRLAVHRPRATKPKKAARGRRHRSRPAARDRPASQRTEDGAALREDDAARTSHVLEYSDDADGSPEGGAQMLPIRRVMPSAEVTSDKEESGW